MDRGQIRIPIQDVIEKNKGIFFKIAKAYCQDPDDRQDLVQEMIIRTWQTYPKYNPAFALSTWLYRISLNVAISFYRKHRKKQNVRITDEDHFDQAAETDSGETERQVGLLMRFIHELKDLDKALMLLYLEEKSHAEIGDILGMSVSNVGTKIGRIKDIIKQRFSKYNL